MNAFSVFSGAHTEVYNDLDRHSFLEHKPWETYQQPSINMIPPAYCQFGQPPPPPPSTTDNILLDEHSTGQFGLMHEKYCNSLAAQAILPVKSSELLPNYEEHSVPIKAFMQKVFHNARERRRRKVLKVLYSQLHSLIPNQNSKRKLSIPNTVGRVLNYIPELRNEIEKLSSERAELLAGKLRSQNEKLNTERAELLASTERSIPESGTGAEELIDLMRSPAPLAALGSHDAIVTVNTAALGHSQMIITIYKRRGGFLLSKLLVLLEKEGLDVLNASTFFSEDKVCHSLHLEMFAGKSEVDTHVLQKKLLKLLSQKTLVKPC